MNKVSFQGLISRSKKLPLGRYTLVIHGELRRRAALDTEPAQVHDCEVALVATASLEKQSSPSAVNGDARNGRN